MSARGKDFLELWIARNVFPPAAGGDEAARIAQKFISDAAIEGLTLEDVKLANEVEAYIRGLTAPGD